MLRIEGLAHTFGQETITYPGWEVSAGDKAMVLGASGSGKTTLLHLIGGLRKAQQGSVVVDNVEIQTKSSAEMDQFRRKNVGIVFQVPHLVRSLTVAENLFLTQYLGGFKQDRKRVKVVLEELGIGELKSRKVHEISQGQAQRVSIARAIINQPKLLLADEPTASLDDESCHRVLTLLKEQSEKNTATLVVATHDTRVKAEFFNVLTL